MIDPGFYDCLPLKDILLEMVADANSADEIINSPDKNPNKPAVNISPVKISLLKFCIV